MKIENGINIYLFNLILVNFFYIYVCIFSVEYL